MAKQTMSGVKCFLGGYDVSGDMNAVAFQHGAEVVDVTTIGDSSRTRVGGLKTLAASLAGFWEAGAGEIDPVLFATLSETDTVLSINPEGSDAGDRSYFAKVATADYVPGGTVGEALAFTASAEGVTELRRGVVLAHVVGVATSGVTTTQNLGAPTTSQTVAVAVHVYGVTGTAAVQVTAQSDDNSGATTPSDRLVFGSLSAVGASYLSAVGIGGGDVHWRTSYTITGAGTVSFLVLLSIQ